MTKRVFGMVTSETKPDRWIREQKLGAGRGIPGVAAPARYQNDPYTSGVYSAERKLRARMDSDPDWQGWEKRFVSAEHAQVYVDLVLSWPWPAWNPPPVHVLPTDEPTANYRSAIYLPEHDERWMRELIVLHELAHHFVRQRRDPHGLPWIEAFSALLADAIDLRVREMFREYLDAEGVRWRR